MEQKLIPYPFSYDDDEDERSRLMNKILKQMFGGNLWSPVSKNAEPIDDVLDIGCGSAVWAQEVANAYPTTQITGFDIREPHQMSTSSGNFTFVQGDMCEHFHLRFGL